VALTRGERQLLERLAAEGPDGEPLTQARPGGWWFGEERVSARIGWNLLRKCLIRTVYENNTHDYHLYVINEEGRQAVRDPTYVPLIIRHLTGDDITHG
jgi:hypothetical protein